MKYLLLVLMLFSSSVLAGPPYNPEATEEMRTLMELLGRSNQHAFHSDQETAKKCEIIRALLKKNADPNTRGDTNGFSPIHWVAGSSDVSLMVELVGLGANVNAQTNDEKTALHYAANQSRRFVVAAQHLAILLLSGADPRLRATDQWNQIPIETAENGTPAYSFLWTAMEQPHRLLREIIHYFVAIRQPVDEILQTFFVQKKQPIADSHWLSLSAHELLARFEQFPVPNLNDVSTLEILQNAPSDEQDSFYIPSDFLIKVLYNRFELVRPKKGEMLVVNNFYSTLLSSIAHHGRSGLPSEVWRNILFLILNLQYQDVLK